MGHGRRADGPETDRALPVSLRPAARPSTPPLCRQRACARRAPARGGRFESGRARGLGRPGGRVPPACPARPDGRVREPYAEVTLGETGLRAARPPRPERSSPARARAALPVPARRLALACLLALARSLPLSPSLRPRPPVPTIEARHQPRPPPHRPLLPRPLNPASEAHGVWNIFRFSSLV